MAELPSGTVTFLFTDLEGSTRLWEEHPDAMRDALARHDEILRESVEQRAGHVVKTTGDGLHAAFSIARDAVATAVDAQRALTAEPWPLPQPLRVRMGIHTGQAEVRGGDYYGPAVNRAARIASVAHGGQILCSLATEELSRDDLPSDVALRDLGEHSLRDLSRPEHLVQINHPELRHDFEPLRSLDATPNNLPRQLASFVGRSRELAEIGEALARSPIVTLTGVGGVGKTRLALQVAAVVMPHYPDGAWLVELAATRDPDAIVAVVASATAVHLAAGPDPGAVLLDVLRQRELLLVLDNCEHVIGAAAELAADISQRCPRVRVLATSREGLGIAGEHVVTIGSLPLTEADGDGTAVQLFVERAQLARPGFALGDDSRDAVVQICRHLDGIPLAIELAAARVKVLAPAAIAERLDHRFQLLAGSRRGVVERHQTLRAAIDWSYDLLDATEQRCLQPLSVFAGGFDLPAAEALVAHDETDVSDVLFLLEALVDKSLLVTEDLGSMVRYRLLETIREYAGERLGEADGTIALRDRHLNYFTELSEALALEFPGPVGMEAIRHLQREVDNLRAALLWAIDRGDVDHALRLVCAVSVADWVVFSPIGKEFFTVGEIPGAEEHSRYAEYLARSAGALLRAGDIAGAAAMSERALAAAREHGVDHWVIHNSLGLAKWFTGHIPEAIAHLEDGLALTPDDATRAFMLQPLAAVHVVASDDVAARQTAEESLAAAQRSGNPHLIAGAYIQIGYASVRDDPDCAFDAYERALELVGDDEQSHMVHYAGGTLAELSSRRGDHEAFARYATAAVTAVARRAEWLQLGSVLCWCSFAFARFGDIDAAAEAFGSAERCGSSPIQPEMRELEALLAAHADDPGVAAARARGASRDPEAIAPWALETIARIAHAATAEADD